VRCRNHAGGPKGGGFFHRFEASPAIAAVRSCRAPARAPENRIRGYLKLPNGRAPWPVTQRGREILSSVSITVLRMRKSSPVSSSDNTTGSSSSGASINASTKYFMT